MAKLIRATKVREGNVADSMQILEGGVEFSFQKKTKKTHMWLLHIFGEQCMGYMEQISSFQRRRKHLRCTVNIKHVFEVPSQCTDLKVLNDYFGLGFFYIFL